jgi:hypothetical protein
MRAAICNVVPTHSKLVSLNLLKVYINAVSEEVFNHPGMAYPRGSNNGLNLSL